MDDRQENVYLAKLAEQAERYDGKYQFSLYSNVIHSFFPQGKQQFLFGDHHFLSYTVDISY